VDQPAAPTRARNVAQGVQPVPVVHAAGAAPPGADVAAVAAALDAPAVCESPDAPPSTAVLGAPAASPPAAPAVGVPPDAPPSAAAAVLGAPAAPNAAPAAPAAAPRAICSGWRRAPWRVWQRRAQAQAGPFAPAVYRGRRTGQRRISDP
jgi:hypothetical protein